MAFNGSGTYVLPGAALADGQTVSATEHNTFRDDVATALSTCVTRDGQSPATANLPMGGFKHTGTAASAATTDYARTDQVQNGAFVVLASVSGADTITASASPAPAAYATGQTFRFVSAGANTGAATLNVNSLGAKAITKYGTTALAAGDIPSGAVCEVFYDGTRFQLVNVVANKAKTVEDLSSPPAIGGTTPAAGTFTALVATGINSTPIGATTPAAGSFTTFSCNNGYGSVAVGYPSRAWVVFTGATGAIKGSGNVSSITRNAAGDYTVNLTSAMPDANFAVVTGSGATGVLSGGYPVTTSTAAALTFNTAGAATDGTNVSVAIFR